MGIVHVKWREMARKTQLLKRYHVCVDATAVTARMRDEIRCERERERERIGGVGGIWNLELGT